MNKLMINLITITLLLTGCAVQRENMQIKDEFFKPPSNVVIAEVSGLEKAEYHKFGNQGLLDMAINEAWASGITESLASLKVNSIVEEYYYQPFTKILTDKSFKVMKAESILKRENLRPPVNDEAKFAPYNFKYLKDYYDANYALVLIPGNFGLRRDYHGFIPLGPPSGYTTLNLYLVDLDTNLIVGHYKTETDMSTHGDWDEPPEYKNLMDAAKNSLIKALQDAYIYFFGWQPKQIN